MAGLPSLAPGSPVGTSYLVFIDDYFSVTQRRDEVLRSLKDDLGRLLENNHVDVNEAYQGKVSRPPDALPVIDPQQQTKAALGR